MYYSHTVVDVILLSLYYFIGVFVKNQVFYKSVFYMMLINVYEKLSLHITNI